MSCFRSRLHVRSGHCIYIWPHKVSAFGVTSTSRRRYCHMVEFFRHIESADLVDRPIIVDRSSRQTSSTVDTLPAVVVEPRRLNTHNCWSMSVGQFLGGVRISSFFYWVLFLCAGYTTTTSTAIGQKYIDEIGTDRTRASRPHPSP